MQIYAKAGDGASSYFPDLNNWEYNFFGGFFGIVYIKSWESKF